LKFRSVRLNHAPESDPASLPARPADALAAIGFVCPMAAFFFHAAASAFRTFC
jgi:hypothetical protein